MANLPKVSFLPEFDITQAMRKMQDTVAKRPLKVNLAVDTKGLEGLNKGLGKLSGSADEFTKSLEAANARVLAFGASVAVISALQRGFVNLVKSTIEVEAAFAKISVVGDQFAATAGQLEKFGRGIFDVARQTGQSFDETSKAALEFARQGLGAAETLVRVKDALTLTRLSGLDATSAVEGLTAAVNSFKKEGLSTTDVLNKLIAVDNKYAVSSGDLIEAIKRSGAFAQEAGIGFDELTATVTVLQEATARGGSVIGNSLKTIFERVGRPESLRQLQDLGVGIKDVQGNILPAIKIIDNFANRLNGMDEAAKRASLRQLAGTLQINQLSALSNALKEVEGGSRRYDEVLATSANASIEAATANEKLNQTLDAQIKSLVATGTQLGSLFGNVAIAPTLKELTEALGGAGKFLIEGLSKDGPTFTKAFANIVSDALLAAGVAGLASVGLILKKFAIFAKDSFSNILGINSAAKNQESLQISILNTLRTRADIERDILALGSNNVAQAQLLAKAYKDAADQDARRVATSKAIAGSLSSGFGIGPTGQPSPRGRRAAGGFVPDLIQAEYKDIKKGTGGANKNAGVVLIKDFPFGGGKKGPMVANTSEGILPMGNSAAVLNKDMLDKMGYGKRAARGDLSYLSPQENEAFTRFKAQKASSEKRLKEQEKARKAVEKAEKDAAEAKRKALNAETRAAKAAEKQAAALVKEQEKLANQQIAETKKRQQAAEKARKEKEKADKIAQKANLESLEAEQKARAKEEEFKKRFPVTAQLQRDQQLRATGKLLPSISGGFGAFGKLSQEDIKRQSQQQILSQVGNALSSGSFSSNVGFKKTFDSVLGKDTTPSIIGNIGFKRNFGGNPDLRQEALGNVPGAFNQFSRNQAAQARAARGSQYEIRNRIENQRIEELKNSIRSRLDRGVGPGDKLRFTDRFGEKGDRQTVDSVSRALSDLAPEIDRAKKTFSEVSIGFASTAGTIFLGESVLKNTLEAAGLQVGKFTEVIRDAAIGVVAFKKINEFKGKGGEPLINKILGEDFKKGRKLGARSGPLSGTEMNFLAQSGRARGGFKAEGIIGGVKNFGSKLLGLLPIVGQFGAGLFVANSVLEAFGIDAYASIKQFVTGLSAEGEKAKESLKTFSESLFEGGKFVGRNRDEVSRSLQTRVQEQRELVRAKNFGISTKDKNSAQIAGENFVKELEKSISNTKIGKKEITQDRFISAGVGGVSKITVGTGKFTDKLFSDLNLETQQLILDQVSEIFAFNLDELKAISKQKGIKTKGNESRSELAAIVSKAAVENAKKSGLIENFGKDLSNFGETPSSLLARNLSGFVGNDRIQRKELKERNGSLFADPQTVQAQVSAALELRKLQLDFTTDAERVLEIKIKTAQISDIERANLQANLEELKLERTLRGEIFDIASKGIKDLTGTEGFDLVKIQELESSVQKIRELGLGVDETKKKIAEIFDVLSGDAITDNVKKGVFAQLDASKQLQEEQIKRLKISNDQLKLETRIADQIRQQQSLIELSFASRGSAIDDAKSAIEGRLGLLGAQGNNPNLRIGQQESIRRSEIGLQIQNLQADKDRAALTKNQKEIELLKDANLEETIRTERLRLTSEEYDRTTQSINDQIAALKIQEGQIGLTVTAATALANSIEQFSRGLGELEASNAFGVLQSGDLSSMLSGLSEGAAIGDLKSSGKTGADAVSFLSERTALRQKESEIISAQTQVQKLQLNQEKKLLEDIFAIKKSGGSADEQIAALLDAQNKRLKEQRSLRFGVSNATAQMQDDIATFGADFGELATTGFKDSLSEALKAAADGTGNLKNALLDVALSFANKLRDAALDNLAKIATNALFGGSGGGSSGDGNIVSSILGGLFGGAQKRAAGGRITGGSGTKDDVPILGMGGEFMINKKSVQKYGPQLFEALNEGRLQKMASGGFVDPSISGKSIVGAANLKRFASQNATSGARDKILSLGSGAGSIELEPESLRLTNFARQSGNPLQTATQEAKDQALSLVFQDQELRSQYKAGIDALKKAEKEKQKQLLISLAVAAVGTGASAAFSNSGASALGSTNMTGGNPVSQRPTGLSNRNIIRSTSSASNTSAGITRALSLPSGGGADLYNPLLPSVRRASGGPVGGSGYGDNVPAMLSGGEFVMNRKAAKNLGLANLNAANSGQSIGLSEEKSEELNEKLLSKLDELVEKMSSNNNVTVNVSMDKNGQPTSSESGSQNEDQKNMNRRIKDAVVQILQEEKRLGGVLRK